MAAAMAALRGDAERKTYHQLFKTNLLHHRTHHDPILANNPDLVLVDLGSNDLAKCFDGYNTSKIFMIANLLRQLAALLHPRICVFMQVLPRRKHMKCTPENFDHYATSFNNFLAQWHDEALTGCFPDNFRFYRMQGWWTKNDEITGAVIPCPTSDWMKEGWHPCTHRRNVREALPQHQEGNPGQ